MREIMERAVLIVTGRVISVREEQVVSFSFMIAVGRIEQCAAAAGSVLESRIAVCQCHARMLIRKYFVRKAI